MNNFLSKIESERDILVQHINTTEILRDGKDKWVLSVKRSMGARCENLLCSSCLANVCPYLILIREGIPSLMEVIKYYEEKELKTGNIKLRVVLKKVIIPTFLDIIDEEVEGLTEEEKIRIKRLIEEEMYE